MSALLAWSVQSGKRRAPPAPPAPPLTGGIKRQHHKLIITKFLQLSVRFWFVKPVQPSIAKRADTGPTSLSSADGGSGEKFPTPTHHQSALLTVLLIKIQQIIHFLPPAPHRRPITLANGRVFFCSLAVSSRESSVWEDVLSGAQLKGHPSVGRLAGGFRFSFQTSWFFLLLSNRMMAKDPGRKKSIIDRKLIFGVRQVSSFFFFCDALAVEIASRARSSQDR